MLKRQIYRRVITFSLFLIMPLVMKFFSPIMTIKSILAGVISASIVTIAIMFIVGALTGRLWCGWLCPAGGAQDVIVDIAPIKKSNDKMRIIKYVISAFQIVAIIGIIITTNTSFDYFYSISTTVSGIDWVFYYIMIVAFVAGPMLFGKRSYCNHFCAIAPVMILGQKFARLMGIKHRRITCDGGCIDCKKCDKVCPVSLDVSVYAKEGIVKHNDCITCYACVDSCPKKVLNIRKENL